MIIEKKFTFESAHQLWNSKWDDETNRHVYGKCCGLHGHSYTLVVCVSGEPNDSGMILNFRDLKEIVKRAIVDRYDHIFLNDLAEFKGLQTTSEIIATQIFKTLEPLLRGENYRLYEVRLSETETSVAIIRAT